MKTVNSSTELFFLIDTPVIGSTFLAAMPEENSVKSLHPNTAQSKYFVWILINHKS